MGQDVISVDELKRRQKAKSFPDEEYVESAEVLSLRKTVAHLEKQLMSAGVTPSTKKTLTPAEVREKLEEILVNRKIEPVEMLLDMVVSKDEDGKPLLSNGDRIRILSELNSYRMPKLKAVETHVEHDMNISVFVKEFDDNGKEIDGGTVVDVTPKDLGESAG